MAQPIRFEVIAITTPENRTLFPTSGGIQSGSKQMQKFFDYTDIPLSPADIDRIIQMAW
jgi:hypothetical protein